MKIRRDINKLIIKKIVEITFVLCFVFISAFLWHGNKTQTVLSSLATYSNINYTDINIKNPISYNMFPMSDDDAMQSLEPCLISLFNGTYTPEYYILVLKIDKKSTLDYNYLNIGIDNFVFSLKDLDRKDDDDYYIFVLDNDSIIGETKEYKVRMWLNTMAQNDMQAKEIIMDFAIINETTQA